jgi:hypothetical protein
MLLRPFFFASKPTAVSRKKIEPALLLVSDTISIISKLDQSTDIYRKQQPFYIHLLVSACALLSLVIAHVAQHHAALAPDLPDDFAESVSKSFRKALALATAYNQKSRASRKLWKRLMLMCEPLVQLGILPREDLASTSTLAERQDERLAAAWPVRPSRNRVPVSPQLRREPAASSFLMTTGENGTDATYQQGFDHFLPDLGPISGPVNMTPTTVNSMSGFDFSGPVTLFGDWPLVNGQTFFSDGELLYEE